DRRGDHDLFLRSLWAKCEGSELYIQFAGEKNTSTRLARSTPEDVRGPEDRVGGGGREELAGLALCLPPVPDSLRQELPPGGGDFELFGPPLSRRRPHPPVVEEPLQVPAERRGIELESAGDINRPQRAADGDHHQDVHLAHPDVVRAERVVVE